MRNRVRHFVGKESSYLIAFIDDLHTLGLNEKIQLPEVSGVKHVLNKF